MSDKLPIATLGPEDFKWLWNAHEYNHVTPVNAAARRLSIFRKHIVSGGIVHLKTYEQDQIFESVTRFDDWVLATFPHCAGIYHNIDVCTVEEMREMIAKSQKRDAGSKSLMQTLRDANFRR